MQSDGREEQLFLTSLMAFADACTQPLLTPSCPFYREESGRAVCNEECRGVLEFHGVSERPIVARVVDGLVMEGREIPKEIVSAAPSFDAAAGFLEDRDRPVRDRATGSLLLELVVRIGENIRGAESDTESPLEVWGELLRRGIDMDRVLIGGVAILMANIASNRAVEEIIIATVPAKDGRRSADAADPRGSWASLAIAGASDVPGDEPAWYHGYRRAVVEDLAGGDRDLTDADVEELTNRPEIRYALSPLFANRTIEWFGALVGHDLEATLRGEVPSEDLFAGFPGSPTGDTLGLWVWERFTLTDLSLWELSSLIHEWQWVEGMVFEGFDSRTLSERRIPVDLIASSAMKVMTADRDERPNDDLFHPGQYVDLATRYLLAGEWERATKLFEGILALRPGDGEAWNNLGFCVLGKTAAEALPLLDRASALQRPVPVITTANQVLALHLLDRDQEAIALASAAIARVGDTSSPPAAVWIHPTDEGVVELGQTREPSEYLLSLLSHIQEGRCSSTESSNA